MQALELLGLQPGQVARRPLILASATATMFGIYAQISPLCAIATLPVGLWSCRLASGRVVKGFKPSPITAGMTAADTPPAYRHVTV